MVAMLTSLGLSVVPGGKIAGPLIVPVYHQLLRMSRIMMSYDYFMYLADKGVDKQLLI